MIENLVKAIVENTIPGDSNIARTVQWMQQAIPNPTSKNFHTQLGVHFEEVSEFILTLKGLDRTTQALLTHALLATHALALHLKSQDNVVVVTDENEEDFLDGLADQIVTATGVGYVAKMDIAGAFGEVNRSNFSKFDDNGKPLLDQNQKIIKGQGYFKPNLKPYI